MTVKGWVQYIPLSKIAALDDCMQVVDFEKIARLRGMPYSDWPPIKLRPPNKGGYYVIEDGNHRTMAALIDNLYDIAAEVNESAPPLELSWRWPRIIPVAAEITLLKECGDLHRCGALHKVTR